MYNEQIINVACNTKEYVPLETLQEFQGKLKKIDDKTLEKLKQLLIEQGFSFPVFVWQNYILDGHQRLTALKSLLQEGYRLDGNIPVVRIQAKDATEAARKLLALNSKFGKISPAGLEHFAEAYNIDLKEELLRFDLPDINADALLIDLDKKAKRLSDSLEDDIPETNDTLRIQSGDLIELGDHRLLCGDATIKESFNILMGNERAHLIVTDPPYGVNYTTERFDNIVNDDLHGNRLIEFLAKAFKSFYDFTIDKVALYIFYAFFTHIQFETALNQAGFRVKQQLIWDKGFVLGRSDYNWCHEPILYCVKQGNNCQWYGDRTNRTVLKMSSKKLQSLKKEELITLLEALQNNKTVWTVSKDNASSYLHPTQKPVALLEKAIKNSSQFGDIIIDAFAGSGSTLLACEKTGRHCRAIEFEPKYCQVIIDRWCRYTNKTDIKINGKPVKWENEK